MPESHEHKKDEKKEHKDAEKKDEARKPAAAVKPEEHVHKPGEPARVQRPGEPAHVHKPGEPAHVQRPGEPAHVHKAVEPAHVHKPGEPAHVHKAGEPAYVLKPGEPAHVHKPGEPAHAHKSEEPAHVPKPAEAVKNVEPVKKVEAPKAPSPTVTAKDLADEIEKEIDKGKAAEGPVQKEAGKEAAGAPAKLEVEGKPSEPEVEIVEEEGEKKKDAKKAGKAKGKKKKKKEYRAQPKPAISVEVRKALELRRELKDKTPNFIRQESYNYKRLGENWRKPQGIHSKLRHHIKARINVVSIGYGGPKAARGLHPSGYREVLVHHPKELDGLDPKTDAARVAHCVGSRKREMIQRRAERMGIRILNEIEI